MVVVDLQTFQILDQTSLEVATAGGLDCGVHQTVTTGHAMEVVLLGSQAGQEAVPNEAARSCTFGRKGQVKQHSIALDKNQQVKQHSNALGKK